MTKVSYRTLNLLLMLISAEHFMCAFGDTDPCVSGISQNILTQLMNPRAGKDLKVLINLPFNRVFCTAGAIKYLIIGDWEQQNQLKANTSSFPDTWNVINVTQLATNFDFIVDQTKAPIMVGNSKYFAALASCTQNMCQTQGTVGIKTMETQVDTQSFLITAAFLGSVAGIIFIVSIAWFIHYELGTTRTSVEPQATNSTAAEAGTSTSTAAATATHDGGMQDDANRSRVSVGEVTVREASSDNISMNQVRNSTMPESGGEQSSQAELLPRRASNTGPNGAETTGPSNISRPSGPRHQAPKFKPML